MDKKTFLQSVKSGAGIVANNIKERKYNRKVYRQGLKDVKKGVEKEADQIFTKTQKGINNTDYYPRVSANTAGDKSKYNKRYKKVAKQVKDVRVKQYKANNKKSK